MKEQTTSYSRSREGFGVVATSTLRDALLALGIPERVVLESCPEFESQVQGASRSVPKALSGLTRDPSLI